MQLPSDSIGISDLLAWRDCPARFALNMRRHTEDGDVPGTTDWTNAYGSAVHDLIDRVTTGASREDALESVWKIYGGYLDPEHLTMLEEDIEAYREHTPAGFELIAAERDCRVPLFMHEGKQVYFRFKIDALYRRIEDHSVFYSRDYKSSAHEKSQAEVDADLQQWAYNWAIHELYPECRSLLQCYEQLRFIARKTAKNPEQREQMRLWLIQTAEAVLTDEVLKPKQNRWCPYCPLVASCAETVRATKQWKGELALIAPMTKEGRTTRLEFTDEGLDLEEVIEKTLPQMQLTRKHLEAAEKKLKELLQNMSSEDRERLGWRLSHRRTKAFSPEGLHAIHDALGDDFYEIVSFSKSAAETVVGKPKRGEPLTPEQAAIRAAELERVSMTTVVPKD